MSYREQPGFEGCAFLVVLTVGTAALLGLAMWVSAVTCSSQSEKMKMQSSWGPLQGCMVKAPRGWMPIESVRDVE
jgi:hypothetical protein